MSESKKILVLGAGPAGLTAAYEALRYPNVSVKIIEISDEVGGISRTVKKDGYRFDLGGHRFFTKVSRVNEFWNEILDSSEFLLRPRMSRIYYGGKLFDYPLKPVNALKGLGLFQAIRCVLSFVLVKLNPPKDQSNFENWVAARFGWHLYKIFFKTYTEKVWGIPASEISSDWAAQRIKNLNLFRAVLDAFGVGKKGEVITTLIDEFHYPKLGPGMLWEKCLSSIVSHGGIVEFGLQVKSIVKTEDNQLQVSFSDGRVEKFTDVISSVPLKEMPVLLQSKSETVNSAAEKLKFRDFLTVALIVKDEDVFPDNWIYIHSPDVKVGRIQNYRSWSPFMVKEGTTCLGLEYFVDSESEFWSTNDSNLIEIARAELEALKLVSPELIIGGYVIRVPKAYPVYDEFYLSSVQTIATWLKGEWPDVQVVGRNGMHRYNNQDHSMLTAMLAIDNIFKGELNDLWKVNVDQEYHEEKRSEKFLSIKTQRIQPRRIK